MLRGIEAVAHPAHGGDPGRLAWLVELAAQPADVDVDDVGERVRVHAPDIRQDAFPAEHAPGSAHQQFDQGEFLGCHRQRLALPAHFHADAVEHEVANDELGVALHELRRPPKQSLDTRQQFVDYYAERAGIRIDNFDFYYVYGLFRLAGIVQQIYYRFFHGQTKDKRFAQFIMMNKLLEQMALQVIGKSTL